MAGMGSFADRVKGQGFEPNHREFGLHVRSPEAGKPAEAIAFQVARRANGMEAVGTRRRSDEFNPGQRRKRAKGSYRVKRGVSIKSGRNRRRGAEVYTLSPSAIKSNLGSKKQRPKHTLLRAGVFVMKYHGFPLSDVRGEDSR